MNSYNIGKMKTKITLISQNMHLHTFMLMLVFLGLLSLSAIGQQTITGTAATNQVLIVKGAASQSANLQEWENNSGTSLVSIGPDGRIHLNLGNSILFWNTANTYSTALKAGTNTSDLVFTLPVNYGTSGYKLTTDGSGSLTWSADGNSGGTVTSVSNPTT